MFQKGDTIRHKETGEIAEYLEDCRLPAGADIVVRRWRAGEVVGGGCSWAAEWEVAPDAPIESPRGLMARNARLQGQLAEARAGEARLRAALEPYADRKHWYKVWRARTAEATWAYTLALLVDLDPGIHARNALADGAGRLFVEAAQRAVELLRIWLARYQQTYVAGEELAAATRLALEKCGEVGLS